MRYKEDDNDDILPPTFAHSPPATINLHFLASAVSGLGGTVTKTAIVSLYSFSGGMAGTNIFGGATDNVMEGINDNNVDEVTGCNSSN